MKNTILIVLFLLILLSPLIMHLFINKSGEFKGTDNQGTELIAELKPGYKPWFIFPGISLPPAMENLLFCLQAALGSGLLFYIIGFYHGKKKGLEGRK